MKEFKLVHQPNNFWSVQTEDGKELTRRRVVDILEVMYWCKAYCSSFDVYSFNVDSSKYGWYNKSYKEIINDIEK